MELVTWSPVHPHPSYLARLPQDPLRALVLRISSHLNINMATTCQAACSTSEATPLQPAFDHCLPDAAGESLRITNLLGNEDTDTT